MRWDYDGLFVIYLLVKEHIPDIQLLTPTGNPKDIKESDHKSLRKSGSLDIERLGLNEMQQALLDQLIEKNQWVIEESNDLLAMLKI